MPLGTHSASTRAKKPPWPHGKTWPPVWVCPGRVRPQNGLSFRTGVTEASGACNIARIQKVQCRLLQAKCHSQAQSLFFARVWALCVPRGTSHRVEFRWGVREMSLTIKTGNNKPKHQHKKNTNQNNQQARTKGQAQVRTSLNEQKVQIRGPTQW